LNQTLSLFAKIIVLVRLRIQLSSLCCGGRGQREERDEVQMMMILLSQACILVTGDCGGGCDLMTRAAAVTLSGQFLRK
jgi:hypothetical protein